LRSAFEKRINEEAAQKISEFFNLLWNFLGSCYQRDILEIGCGFPADLERYAGLAKYRKHKFFCVDPDESKIHSLKTYIQKRGLVRFIKAQIGVCEDLKFSSKYFDAVLAFNTYTHLANLHQSLGEIRRVLKPGGLFFFNDAYQELSGEHVSTGHINNYKSVLVRRIIKIFNFKIKYFYCFESEGEEYWYIIGRRDKEKDQKLPEKCNEFI